MYLKDEQQKREPQSDSPSAVRKHTPFSIHIIYSMIQKNARQILAFQIVIHRGKFPKPLSFE